ncbi:E3 ubiquitin-protein ligase XB3 [Wolffia australiana]
MGQSLSCTSSQREIDFFAAVRSGNVEAVNSMIAADPELIQTSTVYDRLSPLHIAAANGRIEVLSLILDRSVHPDLLNRNKQTPLMLAAMHGKLSCVRRLLQAGANILKFDSRNGRTCLHHAAYYGHADCLREILAAANSNPISHSWGFARFVSVRDGEGATPLHLAARQRRADCVRVLLDNRALVCATTGSFSFPGSTPLHLAARGGSVECIRLLLAWGADRLSTDSAGRIPYTVALRRKHSACATLLNPSSAQPLIWPAAVKFIRELNPDAKALLEGALMKANIEREKGILDISGDDDSSLEEENGEVCCICFDQLCTIEVRDCGHQMCANCTLALCCHNHPGPGPMLSTVPTCPFCRCRISQLVVAEITAAEAESPQPKLRRSRKSKITAESGGSSSFKGLTSAMGSFSRVGRASSGRIADCSDTSEKP